MVGAWLVGLADASVAAEERCTKLGDQLLEGVGILVAALALLLEAVQSGLVTRAVYGLVEGGREVFGLSLELLEQWQLNVVVRWAVER